MIQTPDPWTAVLLLGATYRTWRLIAFDVILDPVRRRVFQRYDRLVPELVQCPWCLGFWIAIMWWAAWQFFPGGSTAIAALLTISLGVGLIARNWDP